MYQEAAAGVTTESPHESIPLTGSMCSGELELALRALEEHHGYACLETFGADEGTVHIVNGQVALPDCVDPILLKMEEDRVLALLSRNCAATGSRFRLLPLAGLPDAERHPRMAISVLLNRLAELEREAEETDSPAGPPTEFFVPDMVPLEPPIKPQRPSTLRRDLRKKKKSTGDSLRS